MERIEELEASVARLSLSDLSTSGLDDRVATLEQGLTDVEDTQTDLSQRTVSLFDVADSNRSEIELMRSCVNDYMETIGRWSSNLGSSFTYFFC